VVAGEARQQAGGDPIERRACGMGTENQQEGRPMRIDFAASCERCGQDFVFGTSKERNDWYRAHDLTHDDFVSFFRQARV
jgi:hypothetical protein